MQQASFYATSLQQQADDLTAQQQKLAMELDALRDPQHLAEQARELGMVAPAVPAFIDNPQVTLLHALMSLRDRPESEKRAWAALFDYYVFGDAERPRAHIPAHARGALAPVDDVIARRLRAVVQRKLNR